MCCGGGGGSNSSGNAVGPGAGGSITVAGGGCVGRSTSGDSGEGDGGAASDKKHPAAASQAQPPVRAAASLGDAAAHLSGSPPKGWKAPSPAASCAKRQGMHSRCRALEALSSGHWAKPENRPKQIFLEPKISVIQIVSHSSNIILVLSLSSSWNTGFV